MKLLKTKEVCEPIEEAQKNNKGYQIDELESKPNETVVKLPNFEDQWSELNEATEYKGNLWIYKGGTKQKQRLANCWARIKTKRICCGSSNNMQVYKIFETSCINGSIRKSLEIWMAIRWDLVCQSSVPEITHPNTIAWQEHCVWEAVRNSDQRLNILQVRRKMIFWPAQKEMERWGYRRSGKQGITIGKLRYKTYIIEGNSGCSQDTPEIVEPNKKKISNTTVFFFIL